MVDYYWRRWCRIFIDTKDEIWCLFFGLLISGTAHGVYKSNVSSALSSLTVPTHSERSTSGSLYAYRSEEEILSSPHLRSFTLNELKKATQSFRSHHLIGEGGFGYVYKGWIDESSFGTSRSGTAVVVAIKKLKPEGLQGHKEWLVSLLSSSINTPYTFMWYCNLYIHIVVGCWYFPCFTVFPMFSNDLHLWPTFWHSEFLSFVRGFFGSWVFHVDLSRHVLVRSASLTHTQKLSSNEPDIYKEHIAQIPVDRWHYNRFIT